MYLIKTSDIGEERSIDKVELSGNVLTWRNGEDVIAEQNEKTGSSQGEIEDIAKDGVDDKEEHEKIIDDEEFERQILSKVEMGLDLILVPEITNIQSKSKLHNGRLKSPRVLSPITMRPSKPLSADSKFQESRSISCQTQPLPFGPSATAQYLLGDIRPWGPRAECLPLKGLGLYQPRPHKALQPDHVAIASTKLKPIQL